MVSFRDIKPQTFGFHDLDRLGSLDVTGRVTLRPVVGGFVYVVHCNQLAVSHGCQDIKRYRLAFEVWFEIPICVPKFSVFKEFDSLNLVCHHRDLQKAHPENASCFMYQFIRYIPAVFLLWAMTRKKEWKGTQSHKTLYFSYLWGRYPWADSHKNYCASCTS